MMMRAASIWGDLGLQAGFALASMHLVTVAVNCSGRRG